MKRVIIILIITSLTLFCFCKDNENICILNKGLNYKEILILKDNTKFYRQENKDVVLKKRLSFLDKVLLIKDEKGTDKIFVKTSSGIYGWVDRKFTSYYLDKWKKIYDIKDLTIMLPDNISFKIVKGKRKRIADDYSKLLVEHRFYSNKYFITIAIIGKRIEEHINSLEGSIKKVHFNNLEIYYCESKDIDNRTSYGVVFKGKDNEVYDIGISLEYENNVPIEYKIIAKRILFNIVLNKR